MISTLARARRATLAAAAAAGTAMAAPTPAGAQAVGGAAPDTPVVTLADALRRAPRADPTVAAARGTVANAAWARRVARAAFFVPALSASVDGARYSTPAFNPGTLQPASTVVTGQILATYDLFGGGRGFADLRRSRAALASAEAGETRARYESNLATATDYFAVIGERELSAVAAERVRRAEEQLAVARARVVSGAAVQTDSLQLVLELTRARVALLERGAATRVARLQLGRRVGADGAVEAAAVDTAPPPPLALTAAEATSLALASGPAYVAARATERAADATLAAERSGYLPRVTVSAANNTFDARFFPNAASRRQLAVAVTLPIWDNGVRELAVAQARVARDVARATREDLERGAAQAVTAAVEAYATARASTDLAAQGVAVARETYRVQQARYRSGATTALDVTQAQEALAQAEADLVQARQRARLAVAALESALGRRVLPAP